jgi:hypothetical protein
MRRFVPLGAALGIIVGCTPEPDSASWTGGVDTLPSGTIVVRNPVRGLWDSTSAWRVVDDLRIGPAEDGPTAFSAIDGLTVDATGRIYVTDRHAAEVRVFTPQGNHLSTLGRKGRGPGEFAWPDGIVMGRAGQVLVGDRSARRVSVFDTSGAFLRDYRRSGPGVSPIMVGTGAVDDTWDAWSVFDPAGGERHMELLRWTDGGYGDTLQFPPFEQQYFEIVLHQGRSTNIMRAPVPFTPEEVIAAAASGIVWRAISGTYRVTQFSPAGDSTLVVTREYQPVAVTADDREQVLPRYRKLFKGSGTRLDESLVPAYHPAIRRMLVDDQGYLWIAPVTTDTTNLPFDVFDPEGRYLGVVATAMTPTMLTPQPVVRDGHFYYVGRDELDVPYVVRLRIVGQ